MVECRDVFQNSLLIALSIECIETNRQLLIALAIECIETNRQLSIAQAIKCSKLLSTAQLRCAEPHTPCAETTINRTTSLCGNNS